MEIAEQNGIENSSEGLIPFGSGVVGSGSSHGDSEEVSNADTSLIVDGGTRKSREDASEQILLDVNWAGVTGHRGDAVVNFSEELNWDKAAKEMANVKSSGAGDEKHIGGAVGLGGGELRKNRFHCFGDREGQEPFSELLLVMDGGPGEGMGGGRRTDVEVVEQEKGLEDSDVVEAESGEGRLTVILVVGGGTGVLGELAQVGDNWDLVGEDINDPFIGGGLAGGRVSFEKLEDIGRVLRDFDFLDSELDRALLEGRDLGRERHGC